MRKEKVRNSRKSEKGIWIDKLELLWEQHKLLGYMILFIVWPGILIFLFECMNNRSLFGAITFVTKYTWAYLCNVLIVSTSFSLAMLIRKRLVFILTASVFWIFCAFSNFVLLLNRVTPLTANDFTLITDLFGVVFKYLNVFQAAILALVVIAIILMIIFLFIKAPALKKRVNYLVSVLAIAFMLAVTSGAIAMGRSTGSVESQFHELSKSYKRNGFLYCFLNTLTDNGVKKPSDYSENKIETLVDDSEPDKKTVKKEKKKVKKANVIIVQLESFFDPNRLKDVTYSQNPIPNFTKLMNSKKTGSGFFGVPVIGAGTVNSEFEVLTGMNIDDFGAGEYPYKTILKKSTCESIAYNVKDNGLSAHAIHNHVGTFYGRNNVYSNMGFDTFTSLEYMWPKSYTGMNWAKDKVLTTEIKRAIESTKEKDFVYAVSVQGHGKYPGDNSVPYQRHIKVSSDVYDEDYVNQVSYYVNQLYEMDQFVGDLVNYCKNQREDTVLVFYGDHMPSLELTDDALLKGNIYQTEYVIWNNMNLKFSKRDIEAYQIGSIVLGALNMDNGVINGFHQKSAVRIAEGRIHSEEYLSDLKNLEYDILYGEKTCYNGINPYSPTILQMGINPITIKDVSYVNGNVMIKGENFTRYSTVYVNEESQETFYISSEKLMIKDYELDEGDMIEVWQRSLSSTDTFIYHLPEQETSGPVSVEKNAISEIKDKAKEDQIGITVK